MFNHNFEKAMFGSIKPHKTPENVYYVTFFFNDEWHYCRFYGNQVANEALKKTIGDSLYDEEIFDKSQYFSYKFSDNGKNYVVYFSYDSIEFFNIFEILDSSKENYDETLVQQDVPFQVLKISQDGNEFFKLSELV